MAQPEWTREQLEAQAKKRLSDEAGLVLVREPDSKIRPAATGPNPIDENDRRLLAGR